MPVKIKKQYKQPDGTLIEVEGTEAEVEAFEKKQQKQKRQIEETDRKKTILYGKDLEEIRKIVQEELKKMPRVENYYDYENHYHYPQQSITPYWANPNVIPLTSPTWYGTTTTADKITLGETVGIGGASISCGQLPSTNTTTYAATGSATYTGPQPTVSIFASNTAMGGFQSSNGSQKYLMSRS